LNHYHWVRWTINGDIYPAETPDSSYHGEDFYLIKDLKNDNNRSSSVNDYLKTYGAILKEFKIQIPAPPEISATPYETEYKFLVTDNESEATAAFELIAEQVKQSGFIIESDDEGRRAKEQRDLYFDDTRLTIHSCGASFRMRQKKDSIGITLKKRLPLTKAYSDKGLYERIEEEAIITAPQKEALLEGHPINVFPYRLIAYIAPDCGKLEEKIEVINNRKTIAVRDESGRIAELCFDKVKYIINGKEYGPYFEAEIESKGASRVKLKKLADDLEQRIGLIPSSQSKYERGISILKTKAESTQNKEKKMVIIDTDAGVDDALALILALKSKELDIVAVTTVSGNVHVDKVTPNVLKVLKAMEIKNPPIIARGAEEPLISKDKPTTADSVHGMDGLGDTHYAMGNYKLDRRLAWEVVCDLAKKHPNEITLITLGPMTNLAIAIQNRPEDVKKLKEVVAMGGVFFNVGNITPDAEFNVKADPDAAAIVVEFCRNTCLKTPLNAQGQIITLPATPTLEDYKAITSYKSHDLTEPNMVPLTFVGLDVTHQVLLRKAALDKAVKGYPRNSLLKFIQDISKKYMEFYYNNEWLPGCYLHDPLAVAYVINPAFLQVEQYIINVETAGQFTSGVIFPDDRPTTNNAWRNPAEEVIGIARRVERDAFEEFLMTRLIS
jgi:purine nucleosidase